MKPQTVNVLGHTYAVEFVEQIGAPEDRIDGNVSYSNQLISIRNTMPERRQPVVLLHEIVHALFETTGHIDHCDDENLIQCLAYGFSTILRANPDLVRYLLDDSTS